MIVAGLFAGAWLAPGPVDVGALDRALEAYFAARGQTATAAAIDAVLAEEPEFDVLLERLRRGPRYSDDVPRGKQLRVHTVDGVEHPWMLFVPEHYDPRWAWPVRWDLHGGMGAPEWDSASGEWSPGWAAVEDYRGSFLTVVPAGWIDSMWWSEKQPASFRAIFDELKRTYNVDEDRVFLFGNSDGAVAAWFYAFRDPDPWQMYVGYVGFPARLTNRTMRVDGQMHLSNLEGQRFYLRNGARDRIVDVKVVRKYVELFRALDVELDYAEHADAGHDLGLTDEEQLEPFRILEQVRRDPLPDRFSWTTERTDRYHRRAWLVIEELSSDARADETNVLPRFRGRNVPSFRAPRVQPWGRVELEREGNLVRARTEGVARFRLFLAPEEFDFERPIRVEVDGELRFEGRLEPDPRILLEGFARDRDRRRLFAAELVLGPPPARRR